MDHVLTNKCYHVNIKHLQWLCAETHAVSDTLLSNVVAGCDSTGQYLWFILFCDKLLKKYHQNSHHAQQRNCIHKSSVMKFIIIQFVKCTYIHTHIQIQYTHIHIYVSVCKSNHHYCEESKENKHYCGVKQ